MCLWSRYRPTGTLFVSSDVPIGLSLWLAAGGPYEIPARAKKYKIDVPHIAPGSAVKWSVTIPSLTLTSGIVECDGRLLDVSVLTAGFEPLTIQSFLALVLAQRRFRERFHRVRTRAVRILQRRIAQPFLQRRAAVRRVAAIAIQRLARGRAARRLNACLVCLDEMPASVQVPISSACRRTTHRVCRPCAKRFLEHELTEGRLHIRCPGIGCEHLVDLKRDLQRLGLEGLQEDYQAKLIEVHAQRLHELMQDNDMLDFAQKHARVCPECGVLIYRHAGCAHMRCRCGAEFSWNDRHTMIHQHHVAS